MKKTNYFFFKPIAGRRQNVIIDVNYVMFENALHTQVLLSLSPIKITSSNIQEMFIKGSSYLLSKYCNFDCYTPKVHFIRSWSN